MILLSTVAPRCTAHTPSCAAPCKESAICLMENIRMLDKLPSGMSYMLMSSVLMDQKYILNKVSFKKEKIYILIG